MLEWWGKKSINTNSKDYQELRERRAHCKDHLVVLIERDCWFWEVLLISWCCAHRALIRSNQTYILLEQLPRRWVYTVSRWLHYRMRLCFLCPPRGFPEALTEGKLIPESSCIFMGVWGAPFSSRPQHQLYPIVVTVIFPVDCSEENFGFHSQTNRIIFPLTPLHCGCIEFLDPPNDTPM